MGLFEHDFAFLWHIKVKAWARYENICPNGANYMTRICIIYVKSIPIYVRILTKICKRNIPNAAIIFLKYPIYAHNMLQICPRCGRKRNPRI